MEYRNEMENFKEEIQAYQGEIDHLKQLLDAGHGDMSHAHNHKLVETIQQLQVSYRLLTRINRIPLSKNFFTYGSQ